MNATDTLKHELLQIIADKEATDENKAKRIIALAVVAKGPTHDRAEKLGNELVAYRNDVLEALGSCEGSEVSIPPGLFWLLCLELDRRAQAFAMENTRSIFVSPVEE